VSLPRKPSPIRYAQTIELPYSPVQMFDLVADIERYPEFLDEYREVKIRSRTDDTLEVDQLIALPLINLPLNAIATFMRPESIIVRSTQPLLGEMEILWRFASVAGGARIDFNMSLNPPSRFGAGLAEFLMSHYAVRTLNAFAERAAKLYGAG
jgi:coenzyme Q-binding protein COQ10